MTFLVLLLVIVNLALLYLYLKKRGTPRWEREKSEIQQVMKEITQALRAKELKAISRYLADDFTAFLDSPYRCDSRKAYLAELSALFEHGGIEERSFRQEKVQVINENCAVVTYHFTEKGTRKDKLYERQGKATEVFRRQPEGWVAVHFHHTLVDETKKPFHFPMAEPGV